MMSLELGHHFSLCWGECVLFEASTVGLGYIGFEDEIVFVVIERNVLILIASDDYTVKLWNAVTEQCLLICCHMTSQRVCAA